MRILSGIQPSGKLHIGNYFGMMEPSIQLQNEGQALYFIADYHSLTTVHDPAILSENVKDVALDFLACGLDPERAIFYRQSCLPEVQEFAWILSTATPMGLLERCTSYKEKVDRGISASHGLFAYPVLMAADILMFDSDVVPVGKDQKQHLEVARDIAVKINERYGDEILKLPEPRIREATALVPGLDGQKMSKSYQNTLPLFGDPKKLRKMVMKIPTDSTPVEEPKSTEDSSILGLYRLFASDSDYDTMVADFQKGGFGYGDFKQRLFDAYWDYFAEARDRREELATNPDSIDQILAEGAEKARAISAPVLERLREAAGYRPRPS